MGEELKNHKDSDPEEFRSLMEKKIDELRSKLSSVLNTKMDKWEKFLEDSRQNRMMGPPR